MHRDISLKVGKAESARPVAAVVRAEQGEHRRVLRDRQELTVTRGPPDGWEIEAEDPDLRNERGCHGALLLVLRRVDPEEGDDEAHAEVGLEVAVGLAA